MIPVVCVGNIVQWSNGRKPLGTVITLFNHRGNEYAVVEDESYQLKVVRIYEKLKIVRR